MTDLLYGSSQTQFGTPMPSVSGHIINAEVLLDTARAHWAIENALHWQPNVSIREDAASNRKDNSPGNIAVVRRRTLDVVRSDTSKISLSLKLKRAGWGDRFLRKILRNISTA